VEQETGSGGTTTVGDPRTKYVGHDLIGSGVSNKEEKNTRENGNPHLLILNLGDYFFANGTRHLYYVQKKNLLKMTTYIIITTTY